MKTLSLLILLLCGLAVKAQTLKGVQRATSSKAYEFEQFGNGLDHDGSQVIVGSYDIRWLTPQNWVGRDSVQGGRAYILERNEDGIWVEQHILESPDKQYHDQFAERGVAISGNYAMVGATHYQYGNHGDKKFKESGAVFMYLKDQFGEWHFLQKLVAPDRKTSAKFGFSLSIEGEYAFVGAIGNNSHANNKNYVKRAGAVYVYRLGENGRWHFQQKLFASDRARMARFGYCSSVSGDYLAIGAYGDPAFENGGTIRQAGAVYIFKKDENGLWHEQQKLVSDKRSVMGGFGGAVCLKKDQIIVGAPSEHMWTIEGDSLRQAGAAYIFKLDASKEWKLIDKIRACRPHEYSNFGISVAILDKRAIVGNSHDSVFYKDEAIPAGGSVQFLEKNDMGRWEKTQRLISNDPAPAEFFGFFVLLGEDYVAISEYLDGTRFTNTIEKNNTGVVYFLSEFPTNSTCGTPSPEYELIDYQHPTKTDSLVLDSTIVVEETFKDTVISTDNGEGEAPLFTISPNPTSGKCTLNILNYESLPYELLLVNPFGKTVFEQGISTKQVELDFTHLGNAIYGIQLSNKYGNTRRILVIKKEEGNRN